MTDENSDEEVYAKPVAGDFTEQNWTTDIIAGPTVDDVIARIVKDYTKE